MEKPQKLIEVGWKFELLSEVNSVPAGSIGIVRALLGGSVILEFCRQGETGNLGIILHLDTNKLLTFCRLLGTPVPQPAAAVLSQDTRAQLLALFKATRACGLKKLTATRCRKVEGRSPMGQICFGLDKTSPMGKICYVPSGDLRGAECFWATAFSDQQEVNPFVQACVAAGLKYDGITFLGSVKS